MHASRRRFAVLAMGLALAAALPGATIASHSWGGYHWARQSNPFTLKLGNNLSSAWQTYLVGASGDWSQSTVLDTTIVPGTTKPRTCKATTGMVQVCNGSYGNNGWLGLASISITDGTHITRAYVKLNDTYFSTGQYNTPAWREMVTCQEVGHTFGLDHQDTNFDNANLGTCMDYTNDPSTNQRPNKHDFDELGTIYSHLDSTTTVGAALPNGSAAAAEASAWGREVSRSRDGRTSVYVNDLGAGQRIVTYVIWA